ncbi:MAG: hypothetical protein HOP20_04855 [Sulfuriferula sp.]|nr:hypothetical protein [Sulfuriferula sp.]
MEITCYRDSIYAQETRTLPAHVYNLALNLLHNTPQRVLFVPIRAMQYLAVLDDEEWVFLDGVRKCWVDIAWQHFQPQQRNSLSDAVAYQAVYYQAESSLLMSRLQHELPLALQALASKSRPVQTGSIIKLPAS